MIRTFHRMKRDRLLSLACLLVVGVRASISHEQIFITLNTHDRHGGYPVVN